MENNRKSAFFVIASAAIFAACSSGSGARDAVEKDAAADDARAGATAGDAGTSNGTHGDSGTRDDGAGTSDTPDSGVADVSTVTVTTPEVTPCSTNPRCGNLLVQYTEGTTVVWEGEDVTDALLNECGTCEEAYLNTQCNALPDAYAIPLLNPAADAGANLGKCFLNAVVQCELAYQQSVTDLSVTCDYCYANMVADFNNGSEACTSDGQAI
jgi:hypothetical protein